MKERLFLAQYSYPCAAPLATQQGTYIGTYENKPFALFEFVPGEHSDNQENYLQVAEAIGQLHTLTIHYRPSDGLVLVYPQGPRGAAPTWNIRVALPTVQEIIYQGRGSALGNALSTNTHVPVSLPRSSSKTPSHCPP